MIIVMLVLTLATVILLLRSRIRHEDKGSERDEKPMWINEFTETPSLIVTFLFMRLGLMRKGGRSERNGPSLMMALISKLEQGTESVMVILLMRVEK